MGFKMKALPFVCSVTILSATSLKWNEQSCIDSFLSTEEFPSVIYYIKFYYQKLEIIVSIYNTEKERHLLLGYLAICTGLNPRSTGVKTSKCFRQRSSCPATNGACDIDQHPRLHAGGINKNTHFWGKIDRYGDIFNNNSANEYIYYVYFQLSYTLNGWLCWERK